MKASSVMKSGERHLRSCGTTCSRVYQDKMQSIIDESVADVIAENGSSRMHVGRESSKIEDVNREVHQIVYSEKGFICILLNHGERGI
jgi:hypothetical protein